MNSHMDSLSLSVLAMPLIHSVFVQSVQNFYKWYNGEPCVLEIIGVRRVAATHQ